MANLTTLRALFIATDKVSPAVNQMRENFVRLEDQLSKADFKELKSNLRQIENQCKDFGGKIGTGLKAAGKALAGAVAGISASVAASTIAFVEYGGAVDDAVNRSGVSAQAFQQLAYAAKMSGSSAETMERALTKLNQGMAAAASGNNKQLTELFDALNIELRDADGNVRNAADVMPELARAFQVNENAAVRTRMAMQLFGRAGTELIPMFADLDTHGEKAADGMDAWRKKAERLGLVLSDEQVAAAAELGDQLDLTKSAFAGLANTVGAQVTPVLLDILPQIQKFIAENRIFIGQKVAEVFKSISKSIAAVPWASLANSAVSITDKTFKLIDALGGLPRILAVAGGAFAAVKVVSFGSEVVALTGKIVSFAKVAGSIAQVTKAFGALGAGIKILGLTIATTPLIGTIALIVAGLTALGYWVYNNWDNIKNALGDGVQWLSDRFDALCSWFSDSFPNASALVSDAADLIAKGWDALLSLPDKVKAAWAGITDFFKDLWNDITGIFSSAFDRLTDGLKDVIKSMPEMIVPDALLEWASNSSTPALPEITPQVAAPTMPDMPAAVMPVDMEPQQAFLAPPPMQAIKPPMPDLTAVQATVPAADATLEQTLLVKPMLEDNPLGDLQANAQITPIYADPLNAPPAEITQRIKPVYDLSGLTGLDLTQQAAIVPALEPPKSSRVVGFDAGARNQRQTVDVSGNIGIDVRAERGFRASSRILQPAGAPVTITANQGAYR